MSELQELRELDAQIAERVMGWVQIEYPFLNRLVGVPPESQTDFRNSDGTMPGRKPVPLYSSDIALAFQVRQQMRELGFTFRLSDADNGQSAVSFFHEDAEQGLAGAAVAETDALAICLAALEAVKEKELAASG